MLDPNSVIKKIQVKNIIFKRYDFEDIPDVINVNKVSLPENYSRYLFIAMWRLFSDISFVAVDTKRDKVIGYILDKRDQGKSFFNTDRIVEKGHVFSIAVLPEYRGRGIGSALLAIGFSTMFKKGLEEIYLEVRVSNIPAIRLYELFGMKVVGVVKAYYADGEDANIMAVSKREVEHIVGQIAEFLKNRGAWRCEYE
ncbi:MAG: GNAT family N-acetyltransferase [Candidatus Njordarchaeia archaeon]